MKSYKIPVLFNIKAIDESHAKEQIENIMVSASEEVLRTDPKLWKRFHWWEFAQAVIKTKE